MRGFKRQLAPPLRLLLLLLLAVAACGAVAAQQQLRPDAAAPSSLEGGMAPRPLRRLLDSHRYEGALSR